MHKFIDNLLVSAPNDGGLYLVHQGRISLLDCLDTTGLFCIENKVFRGVQPNELYIYGASPLHITNEHVRFDDIHDVYCDEEYIYLVGTSGNEIIKLTHGGAEVQRWVFPGEKDSWHINCLTNWNGRIVFSAFGDFRDHREYKGKTKSSGFVQDLLSGDRLISGLSQPHSLVNVGENLLLANSENMELLEFSRTGELLRSKQLDGFTRGICLKNNTIYVGLSRSRNIVLDGLVAATVVELSYDTLHERARVQLPFNEIYNIQSIDNQDNVIQAISDIASVSSTRITVLLSEREAQIAGLSQDVSERETQIAGLSQDVSEREAQIAGLSQDVSEREVQIGTLLQTLAEKEREAEELHRSLTERAVFLAEILSSRSWRLTQPLRGLGQFIRELKRCMPYKELVNANDDVSLLVRARNAARYLMRGDFSGLANRYRTYRQDASVNVIQSTPCQPHLGKTWGIMVTPHTLFIASLLASRLQQHGWQVEIMTEAPAKFSHDWYVVVCPQMFKRLPPGEKRISFQMEQSVSSRWFSAEYLKTLENSMCMFDYSIKNVEFLAQNGIAFLHVFYLPVGAISDYGEKERLPPMVKTYDVLFYGDCKSSERRRQLLAALSEHFDVHIASEVFGREMQELIRSARVVINLHYYENALLETPRIQECLSLGVPVVSERAQDQDDYPELADGVTFFAEGSIPDMIAAVRKALDNPVSQENIKHSVAMSERRFAFMFDRFLLAMGYLPATASEKLDLPLPESFERVVLSLPEMIERRRLFEADRPNNCVIFDGLRRRPGWVGCGLSYKSLALHVLKGGQKTLMIMEDDVIVPADFEDKVAVIKRYLEKNEGEWDVFAGIIAVLHPEAKVLAVEEFDGMTFITINKMISMVFNIYNEKSLQLLAAWNPENLDSECNTIDRFLESQTNLRIVVTLPFFVGHREEVHSSLWGFQNTQYKDLIANSECLLTDKVFVFQKI
jgi:hypothetical protein